MANSTDFRADQVQTSKIIVTGSSPQKTLLIYGIAADAAPPNNNQGNINTTVFPQTAIGTDVFLFVSGGIGARGGSNPWITAFGGDVHVSGNLTVGGSSPGGGGNDFFFSTTSNVIETSGSIKLSGSLPLRTTYMSASTGAQVTGSLIAPKITGSIQYVDANNSYPFLVSGGSITVQYNGDGQWALTGSSVSPGGSVGSVQYYNMGNFAGNTDFTYSSGFQILTAPNMQMQTLSASNGAQITGSLQVNGGITGSISGTVGGNAFIKAGTGVKTNYNSLGQWEITSSIQKINIAGYNRTNLTSPTVIGLAYFNPSEYPTYTNIAFTAVGMNMAGVSGGLDLYNQNTSTLVAQLTWDGASSITTGSFKTVGFSFPPSATSYELHFSQSGGANGGTDYSTVGFVNFVLS